MRKIVFLLPLFLLGRAYAQQPECQSAIDLVRQDSLMRFVKIITGREEALIAGQLQTISSRYAFHPGNDLAAEYLKEHCAGYGFSIQDIPFSGTGRNIVAYKNGTQSDKQAYILCAHYDCVGSSNAPFQGADDNASGVAAVLESARVLNSLNFPYTIVLAFWDEEELGLLGSQAFAPDGPLGYWDVKGVINMDMIAWDGDNDSLAMIHAMPVASSVSLALKMTELNVKYQTELQTVIQNPGETNTDQQSFWFTGATAVGLTEDYENDFNPHWHQWSDSLEYMNLPYFTKISRLAIAAICDLGKTGKVTGTGELTKNSFMIYPNPVATRLTVQTNHRLQSGSVIVYDLAGNEELRHAFSGDHIELDASELKDGIYFMEIRTNGESFRYRFIKAGNE
jgi:hypothetical protein